MSCDFSPQDLRLLLDAFDSISAITSVDGLNAALLPILHNGVRADHITAALRCGSEVLDFASAGAPDERERGKIDDPGSLAMGSIVTGGMAGTGTDGRLPDRSPLDSGTIGTAERSNNRTYRDGSQADLDRAVSGEQIPSTGYILVSEIAVEDWCLVLHFLRNESAFDTRDRDLINRLHPAIKQTLRALLLDRRLQEVLFPRRQSEALAVADSPQALQGLGLSRRESEVLWWAAQGKANKEIGMILGVSFRTIQKHIENIVRKLQVEHRHASVVQALRWLGRKQEGEEDAITAQQGEPGQNKL